MRFFLGVAVRICYKPAAGRIHAKEKNVRGPAQKRISSPGAAGRIPHSYGKAKKTHVREPAGTFFC